MDQQRRTFIFHHAEEQRDVGRSVIPLIGKKPALEWKPYQARRAHLGELAVWFGHGSTHNLGIVCGNISDLVVVDCDTRAEAVWWWHNRPQTPEMIQSGRGVHFYYRYSPTGNRTGVLGRHIDIRGDGGYVVGVGSIHPETGRAYVRVGEGGINLDAVPTFDPVWISQDSKAKQTTTALRDPLAYIRHIHARSGSGGHNATFRAACKLRESQLSESEALAVMIGWNETNAEPPWSLQELVHKVKDAFAQ